MLTFKPVAQRDLSRLRRYYKNCNYQLCEYSALVKLMWRGHLHPQYAEAAGCLIVKNCIDGKPCFDYPVPGPDGDEEAALCAIEDYLADTHHCWCDLHTFIFATEFKCTFHVELLRRNQTL